MNSQRWPLALVLASGALSIWVAVAYSPESGGALAHLLAVLVLVCGAAAVHLGWHP